MKILLYNIGYSTGLKGSLKEYFLKFWRYLWIPSKTLKKIGDFLKNQNADVICLLEVDVGSIRNRFQSQLKMIAEKIFFPFYESTSKYHPRAVIKKMPTFRKQHDAILSKNKGTLDIHYLKSGKKKLVQEFITDGISIFVIHLSLLRKKQRKAQLKELTEILKKCTHPYLVCGDFNIFKGLEEIRDFMKENRLNLTTTEATFPSIKPRVTIDLILACESIRVKASGVVDALFSDHLPVYVEIEI